MRLRRLYIDRHLLLRDLDIRFDRPGRLNMGQYALDFLVGVNGSGKSTLLRVLAQIVADLRADRTPPFQYILEYELQGRDGPYLVSIEQTHSETGTRKHMRVHRMATPDEAAIYDADAVDQSYLPNRIVVYTTGSEAEWERLLKRTDEMADAPVAPEALQSDPVQRAIAELPGHLPIRTGAKDEMETEQQPYLLIRASRLPLVTLCGLLAHLAFSPDPEQRPLKDVLPSLGLRHIRGFSLRFRLHKSLSPFEVYQRIAPIATRHIHEGADHLLVFDISSDDYTIPTELRKEFTNSLNLFEELDRLTNPSLAGEPTLQQVNLFLERDAPPANEDVPETSDTVSRLFLLDWLSDGEQSFIGRMTLLAMLETEDSLILLDEPEVHFNDYWKREIVSLLNKVMQHHTNHMLIISHSSIALSDVSEAHITVLVRDKNGWSQVRDPALKTFGADPSEIMIALFDADLPIGAYATSLLDDAVTSGDADQIEGVLQRVGPGMWRFRLRQRLEDLNAPSA